MDDKLREHYPHISTPSVAEIIGVSALCVSNRARRLGLRKTPERLKQLLSPQAFQRNHETWARWREKQTNPIPRKRKQNTYERVGDHSIQNGVLMILIRGNRKKRTRTKWISMHRHIWEAANGPVPAGHVVSFKPGRATTVEAEITLDAIEVLSRGDLMRRNSFRTHLDPETCRLVQLQGVLSRRIRRLSKELRDREEQDC